MSGESAPKIRFVLCPKCRQLLQESPDFDVYKCGGCGTILQAKKRRGGADNPKSRTRETDPAPRNALEPVSADKQHNKGELVLPQENGLSVKATSSSSGECSSDTNNGSGQSENGECNGEHIVLPRESGEREKATRSSSGDCSLDGNDGRTQIENSESNGKQVVLPQENGEREKATRSSSGDRSFDGNDGEHVVLPQENGEREKATRSSLGDCSLDGNDGRTQIENSESNGKQIVLPQENGEREKATRSSSGDHSSDGNDGEQVVLPQENGEREKATRSSSGDCSLDGNDGRVQIENGESNGKQVILPQENGEREKVTRCSSGDHSVTSLDGNDGRNQIENSECNGKQLVLPQENGEKEMATRSSSEDCSLYGNDGRSLAENDECNGEQAVLHQDSGIREKAASSSLAECSLDGNDGRGQIENGECNGEQLVLPQENRLREKATSSSSGEYSLGGKGSRDQTATDECNGKQLGPFNLPDEELEEEMPNNGCSNELTDSEIKASSELIVENLVESADDTNLQLAKEISNENMPLEGAGEELICALDEENANCEKSAFVGVKPEVDITGSDLGAEELDSKNLLQGAEQASISGSDGEEADNDKSALVGASPEVDITESNKAEAEKELNICASDGEDPKNGQSALVCAKSELDNAGSASTAKRSRTENIVSERGNVAHCKPEEGTSDNVFSPNKQQRHAQKNIHHSFDSVRFVDTSDATEVITPSSELSGNLGELSKSPTTRSSHAYEGSVSSNDGVDEQFPSRQLDPLDNSYTHANGALEGRSRKGKGLVNSMLYGDLEPQHQSYLPSAKHHAPKARRGDQYQVPETTRLGLPYWMRTKEHEFPMPFQRSGSQSSYESGSLSNQTYDEFYCGSTFRSPESSEDPDQEHMKLLRMFYKLQDQLNRTRYANGETNGRLSTDVSYKGNHICARHSHDFLEGGFYHGLDYPGRDGRCTHGINWCRRHNFSPPCLAEAASGSHHVDHPCFRCCSQEWQCSVELPHVFHQHADLCQYHLGHNCCSSHHSLPSSTQLFVGSKLPAYGDETKSGDRRHTAPEVKNYLREKQNFNKRHYRPVAGGAPFVTCRKCSKLLQLPADFLLFKRVCHQLKCGACSEVLKFSLQNRSHIVSYAPNARGPPSSDLDNQNKMIIGSNLHSASHANYDHSSHADPVSYSDDYGHSVSKSYSSEGDPVSVTPLHPSHGNEYDKPSVSQGNFEPIAEEKIASIAPSTSEIKVETEELALHSSNISGSKKLPSEGETRSPQKSSPLHQLMGYSSPSQVIRGVKSSVEGKKTIPNGENDPSHSS